VKWLLDVAKYSDVYLPLMALNLTLSYASFGGKFSRIAVSYYGLSENKALYLVAVCGAVTNSITLVVGYCQAVGIISSKWIIITIPMYMIYFMWGTLSVKYWRKFLRFLIILFMVIPIIVLHVLICLKLDGNINITWVECFATIYPSFALLLFYVTKRLVKSWRNRHRFQYYLQQLPFHHGKNYIEPDLYYIS